MRITLEDVLEKTFYFSQLGSLRNFISWLDNEICIDSENTLLLQVLAVSVKTLGEELVRSGKFPSPHPVLDTYASADDYVKNPTAENWEKFFLDSTNSYPFGPGEGCHSIRSDCKPGSGCKSGAGTLLFTAESIPLSEEQAIAMIHREIGLM